MKRFCARPINHETDSYPESNELKQSDIRADNNSLGIDSYAETIMHAEC